MATERLSDSVEAHLHHKADTLQGCLGAWPFDASIVPLFDEWVVFQIVKNRFDAVIISVEKRVDPRPLTKTREEEEEDKSKISLNSLN